MVKEDQEIIDLYWQRNEDAITETDKKYQNYLMKISHNILACFEDCEENLNDTYLKAWALLPPNRPNHLSLFLGKIARLGAIDLWRSSHSEKRGQGEFTLCLEELGEVVSGQENVDDQLLAKELGEKISGWLKGLPKEKRVIFIGRYFYNDSIKEIAAYCGITEAKTKVVLHRCRAELKMELEKAGYQL